MYWCRCDLMDHTNQSYYKMRTAWGEYGFEHADVTCWSMGNIYTNQFLVNLQSMFNSAAGYYASMMSIQKHWYGATWHFAQHLNNVSNLFLFWSYHSDPLWLPNSEWPEESLPMYDKFPWITHDSLHSHLLWIGIGLKNNRKHTLRYKTAAQVGN